MTSRQQRLSYSVLRIVIALLLIPVVAQAAAFYNMIAFWQGPALTFTTATQTLYPNVCSSAVTVQSNLGGKARKPSAALTVNLAVSGPVTAYSDSNCATPVSSVTMAASASTVSFYLMSATTGAYTVSAASTGYHNPSAQSSSVVSNPFIWTGAAADNVFKTAANWSGGAAPGTTDVAYFDNSCSTYCSPHITQNTTVGGIRLTSSFTGTLTQNSGFTFTSNTRGWQQDGGTFVGSSAGDALTVTNSGGFFILTGGSFTASSGTTTVNAQRMLVSGGTFNSNGGKFSLTASGACTDDFHNITFSSLSFGACGYSLLSNATVTGDLYLASTNSVAGSISGSTLTVGGNVYVTNYGESGTTVLNLNGSTNQTIDTTAATTGNLPGITISSTGGTVSLLGSMNIYADYIVSSGTVNPGTSNLNFYNSLGSRTYTFSGVNYNNVSFYNSQNADTITDTLNLNGNLVLSSTNQYAGYFTSGIINVKGNVSAINYGMGGTATLNIAGSSNQSVDCTAGTTGYNPYNRPLLPKVNVASTGGTVSFAGTCSTQNGFSVSTGTVNFGTSSIEVFASLSGCTVSASGVTFNNFRIYSNGSGATVCSLLTSLAANNLDFKFNSGTAMTVSMPNPGTGYSLNATGTLTIQNHVTLNLYGATHTEATLSNLGTLNP